jgi:hypothetical protein
MGMTSVLTDMFTEEVDKLVERAPAVDGLNLADVLQRAATAMMKQCMGVDDGRDQACFELLDEARRELIEHARERRAAAEQECADQMERYPLSRCQLW